ncbi:hypothetical protein Fmac_031228 [Flemingia macrophylla]|uniref:Cation efflux protein cytoplasmic domain-containing protein n=1 Tax=Flemingia macrophylla TaxID=520843 RepID=A0ABD1L1F2_9FABA
MSRLVLPAGYSNKPACEIGTDAVLGDKFYRWIDPAGVILLSITITNWSGNVMENAVSLAGQSAPPEVLQKPVPTHLAFYTLWRIDVPLKEAHAIGESLQIKPEKLAEVERAFVHLDFECEHKPEHSVLRKMPDSHP